MNHVKLEDITPVGSGAGVLLDVAFCTPWQRFDYAVIDPGQVRSIPTAGDSVEWGCLVLEGRVEIEAGAALGTGVGTGFVIGPVSAKCEVRNAGDQTAHVLYVEVATDAGGDAKVMREGVFDEGLLTWRDAIHGGSGRIATRHVLRPEDFHSTWTFLDHAILSAGGSVGYHYHDALEECFVVLRGRGLMTIDDETFEVSPGSVTWQGIGRAHGIFNPGPDALDFLRVAVAHRDEPYTTVDLHDDLSRREPTSQE